MSTDSQLRKRKDNKKKRKDDEPQNEDINIHIHKEGGTGGGICAKIVFIFLSCALIVLIGLIIKENQGLTELENIESENRFAQVFEGWIEEHVEDHSPEVLSHEDSEHNEEGSEESNLDEEDDTQEDEEDDHKSDETEATEEEDENIGTEEDEENEESQLESEEEPTQESEEETAQETEETLKESEEEIDADEESPEQSKESRKIRKRSVENLSLKDKEETESAEVEDADVKEESKESKEKDKSKENIQPDEDKSEEQLAKTENPEVEKQGNEDSDQQQVVAEDKSGVSTKFGVGLALLVVAYKVFLRKRTTEDEIAPVTESEQIADRNRRNTIIPPPPMEEIEPDLVEVENQDYSEEEYSEEESIEENHRSPREDYQELRTTYSRSLTPEGDFVSKNEDIENIEDLEYAEEEEYMEEEQSEEELNSQEEDDDEDEELLKRLEAKYGKIGRDVTVPLDDAEYDSDRKSEDDYEFSNSEQKIIREAEAAEKVIKKNAAYANKLFDALIEKYPSSPQVMYGKARSLDTLAEQKRSNELLNLAVSFYAKVLTSAKVPDTLFIKAAERYIDRQTFLGNYKRTVLAFKKLIERFPDDRSYVNKLVVTYLTMNEVEEARTILKEILENNPGDGFALVHYGFILKTTDTNLIEAVKFLERGLDSDEQVVKDGRFYYHLGDALIRLGRKNDAMKVFEDGVKNKVLLSKYQRSLYNVPNLSAKPWWEIEELPKIDNLIRTLKSNWKNIRNEAINVLDETGYFLDEKENLRETGDWKQLDLFVRGQKLTNNCAKTPVTCSIIQMYPEASKCRRGQTKFSVMHPNTHVWAHCGPTNTRLRMHLGLVVPNGTYIRVATDTRSWKEGDVIIFDDSFEHEVWHNGTSLRLILMVDVWHPELPESLKRSLSAI